MRICEVLGKKPTIEPSVVSQQQRIQQLVQRNLDSERQQEPTEIDKVMAVRRYGQLKKKTDQQYAKQLRQQLAIAQSAVQ